MKSIAVSTIVSGHGLIAAGSSMCQMVDMAAAATNATVRDVVEVFRKAGLQVPDPPDFERKLTESLRPKVFGGVVLLLNAGAEKLKGADLSPRFVRRLERVTELVKSQECSPEIAHTLLSDAITDLVNELSEPLFLVVAPADRSLYEQPEPLFGGGVADAFDLSSRDIAAAGRCLALGEWTACVSHLMRALESPLQVMAARVGVTFPAPTDLENWKTIVDQMAAQVEVEARRLEGTKKSHERNEELQLLGEVALDFRHFKNAWRNNVAHGREWYDERDARRVFDAVKHFMEQMAMIAASDRTDTT